MTAGRGQRIEHDEVTVSIVWDPRAADRCRDALVRYPCWFTLSAIAAHHAVPPHLPVEDTAAGRV
ncbi:hypothetical protein [Saccharothrix sp.]|uniref:hypothetical protein n=1 Tax=Saccharothrix sp. TaxID=1873460 RepID=UPI0028114E37|nr:hypothetical protein [Saccharothrix sp.]